MALQCDVDNATASVGASPWTGGGCTIAFWVRKTSTGARNFIFRLRDSSDGDPVLTLSCNGTNVPIIALQNSSSVQADVGGGGVLTQDTWKHVAIVLSGSSYAVTATGYLDAVAGSATGSKTMSTLNQILFGVTSTTECDCWFAHAAIWDSALSGSQITELQTKLPSAVGSPVCYWPFLTDAANDGSGGATYDLSLSSATIDSTHDSSLPTLSGATATPKNSGRLMLGVG